MLRRRNTQWAVFLLNRPSNTIRIYHVPRSASTFPPSRWRNDCLPGGRVSDFSFPSFRYLGFFFLWRFLRIFERLEKKKAVVRINMNVQTLMLIAIYRLACKLSPPVSMFHPSYNYRYFNRIVFNYLSSHWNSVAFGELIGIAFDFVSSVG